MTLEKLVQFVRETPPWITSHTDQVMNRNTLFTFGGIGGYIGLSSLELLLHSNGVDFGLPPRLTLTLAILPPALPIFKGVAGNFREFFPLKRVLSLPGSDDRIKMGFAGYSMHLAGEYSQGLAILLGGPDFGTNWPGSDLKAFFFDPHNLPYWALNLPGFFLIGKAGLSGIRSCVNETLNTVRIIRSLAKEKSDHSKPD